MDESQMTFDELIAATTITECGKCGLRHSSVRSCDEAREWDDYKKGIVK